MIYVLWTLVVLMTLHSFYVGGRLAQSEKKLEVFQSALHRHLTTGETIDPHTGEAMPPRGLFVGKVVK